MGQILFHASLAQIYDVLTKSDLHPESLDLAATYIDEWLKTYHTPWVSLPEWPIPDTCRCRVGGRRMQMGVNDEPDRNNSSDTLPLS